MTQIVPRKGHFFTFGAFPESGVWEYAVWRDCRAKEMIYVTSQQDDCFNILLQTLRADLHSNQVLASGRRLA